MHRDTFQNSLKSNLPQKLSLLYIEQGYFHRIQIRSISSLYKLNIKLKKPIILSLHSLQVIKHIIDHSQIMNSILQMQNIYEIKLSVPGYGIFNQKYQLQKVSQLFLVFSDYCQNVSLTIRKIILQFPGWRTFSCQVISNFFRFVAKCQVLEEFSININHAMDISQSKQNSNSNSNLNSNQSEKESQKQTKYMKQTKQNEDDILYGKRSFQARQFQILMKCIANSLSRNTLNKLQLRFGAWNGVDTQILEILIEYLKAIYQSYKNVLKTVKLDLHGWGAPSNKSFQQQIKTQSVNKFFRMIQQFDGEDLQLLQIDMRNWSSRYNIKKYKDKFQYLNSGKRKQDMGASKMWNMTGTNFFGSQLKSKIGNRMKVQIKD